MPQMISNEYVPASVLTLCNVRPPPWPPPTPAPSICDPAPPSSEVNGLNARKANMKTHNVMRDRSSMPPNVEVISIGSGQTMIYIILYNIIYNYIIFYFIFYKKNEMTNLITLVVSCTSILLILLGVSLTPVVPCRIKVQYFIFIYYFHVII